MKKDIIINYREITNYIGSYFCPYCKVTVEGAGITENVIRFNCESCGKELNIIGKKYIKKGE